MELRVYAEDPMNDFLPNVGNLSTYKLPEGEGIRVDNGIEEGMDVPIYYDPMPVSYTHLDVYKRQIQRFTSMYNAID